MENSKLINALYNCVTHCNYCADACLDTDNIEMMVSCIRTDRACAEICSTTAKLLASNYRDIRDLVEYCKSLCERCAEECSKHKHKHCQECAEACRKCVEECNAYLA